MVDVPILTHNPTKLLVIRLGLGGDWWGRRVKSRGAALGKLASGDTFGLIWREKHS